MIQAAGSSRLERLPGTGVDGFRRVPPSDVFLIVAARSRLLKLRDRASLPGFEAIGAMRI